MSYTVAVDFDGVLHSYTTPWSGAASCPDPPVPGAIEWLNEMVTKFEVVILSTRGDQEGGNEAVRAWLREHGYTGPELRVTCEKVPALVYVDDRAWRFDGHNFPTVEQVHRAIPWNKPRPDDPLVGANCTLCGATADNFHVPDELWRAVGLGEVQACFKCFRIAADEVGVTNGEPWEIRLGGLD